MSRVESVGSALAGVESGQRVFVHGGAATPGALVDGLVEEAGRLRDVEVIHLHTEGGGAAYAKPEFAESFRVVNLFVGANLRRAFDGERVDYLPCFLSEIPALFRSGRRAPDVALVQVSPPDRHGLCSLGVSVDVARAAVETAKVVIAQVNPNMPRVLGDGIVPLSRFDRWVEVDAPLPEVAPPPASAEEDRIAGYCAELVEDGACLQMGIGAIPNAVLGRLADRRHLGIHTEMWSDGALALIQSGAVDNARKRTHPGKTVSSFVMGTKALYEFVDDNPTVFNLDVAYVNRVQTIAKNKNVVAINSAVEVDLTGQVCADSIGHRIISGVGGQMDFIRGASLSEGGKPIIALTSRTKKGISRLVPTLKTGAGVVTTRAHVHHVITEYGKADLYGKTLNERAAALIEIAHPDDREELSRAWRAVRAQFG